MFESFRDYMPDRGDYRHAVTRTPTHMRPALKMPPSATERKDTPRRRLIDEPRVRHMTSMGSSFIRDACKAGEFPAPVKVGRANRWVESEVLEWIRGRMSSRMT